MDLHGESNPGRSHGSTMVYEILVKIPDSVLDSTLALRGKEGDIVREKLQA